MLVLLLLMALPQPVLGHTGGLAADGCHNDRKNGGRHCHGGSNSSPPTGSSSHRALGVQSQSDAAYPSCSAARAAGAAPVRRGQAGYGPHLDRDGNGVGCE